MITWLSPDDPPESFPPVSVALREPQGLLAAGGDLGPKRLLAGYRRGIFPWFSPGQPILWWSPDPREVLLPGEFHCSRSLTRLRRSGRFETGFDTDFAAVITACAEPRRTSPGTWITDGMQQAYLRLHALGHAHSIEVRRAGRLVGGLYGVQLDKIFFGESMFSRESNASKIALAALVDHCLANGIDLIDCQLASPHLRSLGSRAISRREFLLRLGDPSP